MSTPLPDSASDTASDTSVARAPDSRWHAALREPLLHFVVLGALLFAIDHVVVGRQDDAGTIVVPAAVDAEARRLFADSRGRPPNDDEFAALRMRWVDNEVLYREGRKMRVDQGDPAIRDRVIFKALMSIEAGLQRPPVDDTALRAWFETKRAKYDDPARYDFEEAVLPADATEATMRAFVDKLNTATPGDAQAGLRVFKARPHDNLVQGYGADFATALGQAPVGRWVALPTRDGLRAMRLAAVKPPQPASFEALRGVVLQDWTDATMAQLRTDAVRALGRNYTLLGEQVLR